MRIIQKRTSERLQRVMVLSALTLLVLLGLPRSSSAQQWTTNGNNISNTNTGNVGIGTSTPIHRVEVIGGGSGVGLSPGNASAFGSNSILSRIIARSNFGAVDSSSAAEIKFLTGSSVWYKGQIAFFTNNYDSTQGGNTLERMRITEAGNVGIGTTAPANQLHVNNAAGVATFLVAGSGGGLVNFQHTAAPVDSKLYQWRSEGGVFRMALINDAWSNFVQQNILVATSAGNIGMGTASPTAKLDVAGQIRSSTGGFKFPDGTVQTTAVTSSGSSGWTNGGAIVNLTNSSANVGIGTASPLTKLHVAGGTRVDGTSGRLYLGTGAATGSRGLEIIEENATTFSIRHHDPNVAWRNIVINPYGGNVGIGILAPNPAYKLDITGATNVTGDLNATGTITGGTINAKYQDVAEWVSSTQELSAGTVVVLDHERSNHVVASSQTYDTRVAGVVSAQPGVLLGEGGPGKVMVATTGRVRVKVDATRAPIRVGDLLVTGEGEGLAMKSMPIDLSGTPIHRPGTIIGKALEPLEKGTGEILVLLSLQ